MITLSDDAPFATLMEGLEFLYQTEPESTKAYMQLYLAIDDEDEYLQRVTDYVSERLWS